MHRHPAQMETQMKDQHWANPIEGPTERDWINLDRSSVRLLAALLVVFWIAVGCAYLVVTR